LLLITDAPPHIPDREMQTVDQTAAVLAKNRIDQLHLVVYARHRSIFEKVHKTAKGEFFDLHTSSRGGASFASVLPRLSSSIAERTIASLPPSPPPPASEAPPAPPPPAGVVEVPPAPPPPPGLKGVQSSEAFAAGSSWQLLLAISSWTGAIAACICVGLFAGQHYYLRQNLLDPALAARGFGGGLAAGLIGGAAGQLLFQAAPSSTVAEALFRILGWALLGSLAGLGMAFFIPNLRSDKGLLGGALGGAAGALGFLAVALLLRGTAAGDAGARLLGAALLGLCLGVMVALAEQVFRKAWLEIRYGGNEIRTVNLGPEPVSIGSDTRMSMIYARNAPPQAFRYWFRDGTVNRVDASTGQVTEMRPGEQQAVGAVTVVVCTAAGEEEKPVSGGLVAVQRPATPAAPGKPVLPSRPAGTLAPVAARGPTTDGCPGCGRTIAGSPGRRYCIVCDRTF
jgi:hypothetical protein